MHITLFNGSPRGARGNTHWMIQAFTEGAQEAGATTDLVQLHKKTFQDCRGCFHCWTTPPGACIHKDDMPALLDKFKASDLVVFATPLYVDNVTGIMKRFMDRLIPLVDPYFERDPQGEYRHKRRFETLPKIAALVNCGLPEQTHFQVVKLLFERVARNMQSEFIGGIYRGQGELLQVDKLALKPILSRYRKLLRRAARELIETQALSEKTQQALEAPLIPKGLYMKGANRYWDREIAQATAKAADPTAASQAHNPQ